jgi:hypothetical protein
MKKTFLLALIAASCLLACKKGAVVSPGLFGKWELRHSYGGLAGFDSVYKAGNGTIYQFNSDSTYKHFTKNKLDAQGNFHIKKYNNPSENSISLYMIFFGDDTYGDAFSMKGDTITIGITVTDGIASDYKKISN